MRNFTKLLLSATLMVLTNLTGTYAQVDQTFWFVAPETTRQHAKTPGILRVTAFDQPAQVRISQPANPDFHPIELTVPAGTQQKVEFHDYGQNIKGYNSSGNWVEGLNVAPPRRGDGSLELEKMLSAIENGTMDQVRWNNSVVLDHDWPGIASNEPTGVNGPGDIPILNKGLLIESTNGADISVYYEVANPRNPERFNMKGRNALGREFLIPSQNRFMNYSGMHKAREKVDIVATQDGTTLTINFDPESHNFVGKPSSGSSFSVTLNRGETFVLRSNSQERADLLGGIFVEADKDIAITISDDSIIESTSHIHYDLTGDQLIPVNIAGTSYIAVHPSHGTRFQSTYEGGNNGSVSNQVFIWPVGDPTVIKINGAAVKDGGGDKMFSKGQFHVEQISENGIYIETNQPVIVYQVSSYKYELGSAVLPALECTGSRSVSFARVYDENFFIQILTKNKNILNESGESNFQAYYQTEGGGTVDVTNRLFTADDGKTSSGWQLVENTGITDGNEQWYTYVKYFDGGQGLPTGVPITVKFRDNADNAIFSDELFHLSVLDANGASMSYGYFSAYNSVAISAPAAACVGTDIELRTNGVLADWYHESDPITPFEESATEVHVTNPGTYWVLIPNSSCQSSDPVTIDYIIPNFDLGDDFTACPGDPIELGIDELPYHADYTWTVNGTEVAEGDPWSHSFTAAENSSYTIRLTVAAELYGIVCEHSDEIVITVGPEPFISLAANEAVCAGSELVAEYRDYQSYEWSLDGEIISTENSFVPDEAGPYTLVVRTTDGCEATQDIQVSIHDLPMVTLDDLMDCVGEKGEFQVSGFPAGSSFRWYNGETWSAPTTGTGSTFTATEPMEQIVVEVTDINRCVATAEGSFGWHKEKVFEQEDIVICYAGEYSIDVVDENGEYGPLTWTYSSDGGATWDGLEGNNQFVTDNSILTIRPIDASNTFSGQYRVEGTYAIDGKNCPIKGEFNLQVEGIPKVSLRPQGKDDAQMCAGGTLTITIDESNLDASSMTYEWGWSDQDTEDPLVTIDDAKDPWIVAGEPGWYFVRVEYGDNMCVAEGRIEVITIPSPTMNADDVWVCPEGKAILSVDMYEAADGNKTPASYEWIKAEPGLPLAPNHPILSTGPTHDLGAVSIDNAGFYRVTTFDKAGCYVSDYIEVGMYNVPAFALENASICEGETFALTLPEGLNGASGTALWERRNDDATYYKIQATDVSDLEAGSHTLRLSFKTDDGCIESAEMTLTVLPAPEFSLPAGDVCEGDDITIIAEDSFSNYSWSMPGNALEGPNEISFTPNPNANGTVTLTVTHENGCTATRATDIFMHTLPLVSLSDQTACPDEIITFSVPHDPANHTIIWTLPSGRTMRGTNTINTVEGTYTVTVADQYGCSASDSATVNWHDFPWVFFGPNLVDVCPFELPVHIAAHGDRENWKEMIWHDGLRDEYERIASLSDTVNVIRVMNVQNCWSTASQSVLLALPSQFEAGRDVEACEPVDGTPFEEILEAGDFTYYDDSNEDLLELPIQHYTWFRQASEDSELDELASGEDAREFVATQGGRYIVEVFDGCWSLRDTFNIDLFPSPVIAGIDSTIYQQIVVMAESGTEPYSYTLNNGQPQNDPTFTGLGNGDYTVFVVDDKGCEASTTFRFESSYDIKVPNFFTPNGDGYNDTWLIEGLEKLPESIIYIYDRYGKLLRKYTSNDPAWNGEYLSRPVPSDDYWYVIHLLPVDKLLKGHFTLKR